MDLSSLQKQLTTQLPNGIERDKSLLLQFLQAAQFCAGHITSRVIHELSETLKLPVTEIEGVISFYSFLHTDEEIEYNLHISNNITDQFSGSQPLFSQLCEQLHGHKNVLLDTTSCIGQNDQGPALLINGLPITDLDEKKINQICRLIDTNTPVSAWPDSLFKVTSHIYRKDLLLESAFKKGSALRRFYEMGAEKVLQNIKEAGLRGRGGAGFSTADKWQFCKQTPGHRIVICNADEGEPGTFKDRVLLTDFAEAVIEGMTLCAGIIGAEKGILYLRAEYQYLLPHLLNTLSELRDQQLLGPQILGHPDFNFDIDIHIGAGAYICGEESALIESAEGKRGIPRKRPPFPVNNGYLGQPTVVNNVETFMAAARIIEMGADWFTSRGTNNSRGTKILSVSGDCRLPGIYEYPWGVTLQQILADCSADNPQAVQVAGAAGHLVPASDFTRTIAIEDLATGGSIMVIGQQRNLIEVVKNFSAFFRHESCGFCTPCRVGTSLQHDLVCKLAERKAGKADLQQLREIAALMHSSSHCGLGATAGIAVLDLLEKFPDIIEQALLEDDFQPAFDLQASLQAARSIAKQTALDTDGEQA